MSIAFSQPEEGDEMHGPDLPRPIRLSDIGQIAAERLDGGADVALNEPAASHMAEPPSMPESEASERAEAESSISHAEGAATPLEPAPGAEPGELRSINASAEPSETTDPGQMAEAPLVAEAAEATPAVLVPVDSPDTSGSAPETASEEHATRPVELVRDASGGNAEYPPVAPPAFGAEAKEIETLFLGAGTDAEPSDLLRSDAEPGADASPPSPDAKLSQTTPALAAAHGALHGLDLVADGHPEDLPMPPAPDTPVSFHAEADATRPPLTNALGAAAKLAADANAAAEALENLKRLLERQLPNPAQAPQPLHTLFATSASTAEPPPLSHHEPPPEMPDDELHAAPARSLSRKDGGGAAWRERRQFDVRGFMAGFALSWAIGAALYIYLTAG
jgi:hypothetical protein